MSKGERASPIDCNTCSAVCHLEVPNRCEKFVPPNPQRQRLIRNRNPENARRVFSDRIQCSSLALECRFLHSSSVMASSARSRSAKERCCWPLSIARSSRWSKFMCASVVRFIGRLYARCEIVTSRASDRFEFNRRHRPEDSRATAAGKQSQRASAACNPYKHQPP